MKVSFLPASLSLRLAFLPASLSLRLAFLLGALPATALQAGSSPAEEPVPDKSGYHLFNPVPRAQMRELVTDRPDQTESPYTVDAGHFQVEMDFVNLTYDRHSPDGVHTEAWNVAPINVRIGLTSHVELDVISDSYLHVRTRDGSTISRASGFGDITTRFKINFWGNDGGSTALGLIPFVKLPLNASHLRNGRTEGGIILPLNVKLPGDWEMGVMTEADFVSDDRGDYDTEWVNSVSFSRNLTKQLGTYLEFYSVVGTAPGFAWQAQADVGLTYAVTDDIQVDCGCNFGLTKSAPDFQPFAGISVRF